MFGIVIWMIVACVAGGVAGAQELPSTLTNPGFEQVDAEGFAVGWERWMAAPGEAGAVSVDANVPFRGARSLRVHHERATSYSRGQQAIKVEPGQRYYFRVWMKGENIQPEELLGGSMGARMYVEGIGGRDHATGRQAGTFGWRQLQIGPFDSGQGGKITVMCYLHHATGTAWFDDIEVIKATPDFEAQLRREDARRVFNTDLQVALAAAEAAGDQAATGELRALAERGRTTEEMPEQLDYRQGPPYFPLHAELLAAMARLNARPKARPLVAWSGDPFAALPVTGVAPQVEPTVRVVMGTGERDQGVLNLCNLGDRPLAMRVTLRGLDGAGAPQVTLREAVHIDSGEGVLLADPLPRLRQVDGAPVLQLPPGLYRQLWLDVSSRGARPGRYRGTIALQSGAVRVEAPLTVEVLAVSLPDPLPITTWNYSYQREPLIKDRWEQARRDLVAHHINAYCWPSHLLPWPEFDADGKLKPLDWTAFDEAVKAHDNIRCLLLWPGFEWEPNLKLRQELEVGSALWEERFVAWFRAMIAGLKERGFGHDRVVWYPTDEPTTGTRVGQQVAAARAIHKADPQARVLANPYAACTQALLEQMAPQTDVWCAELNWARRDLMPFLKQDSKLLWTYQVQGFKAPAFERHRLSFWECWRHGITGQGFWAYADGGGSIWDRTDSARNDYAVVYDGDAEELIPSKRWEAWREGVEDFALLWMLQEKGQDPRAEVAAMLEQPSPEAVSALREKVLRRLAE